MGDGPPDGDDHDSGDGSLLPSEATRGVPLIVPGFFEQQRRMRARSAVLLVGIFVLLVAVVSLPLIVVHTEEECASGGTV